MFETSIIDKNKIHDDRKIGSLSKKKSINGNDAITIAVEGVGSP